MWYSFGTNMCGNFAVQKILTIFFSEGGGGGGGGGGAKMIVFPHTFEKYYNISS